VRVEERREAAPSSAARVGQLLSRRFVKGSSKFFSPGCARAESPMVIGFWWVAGVARSCAPAPRSSLR
jgi:hypothetical protein